MRSSIFTAFRRKDVQFRWVVGTALLVVFLLTFILGFLSRDFSDDGLRGAFTGNMSENGVRLLELDAELINIDTDDKTVTLDWTVIDKQCILNASACTDASIFIACSDQLVGGTSNPSNNQPPDFYFNATAFNENVVTPFNANPADLQTQLSNLAPSFRTTFTFKSIQSRQRYPFDSYRAYVSIYAINPSSNQSVSLLIGNTIGSATGYTTSVVAPLPKENDNSQIAVLLTIRRGQLIKIYAVVIVISIWLVSLVFLIMTIRTVFFLYPQRGEALIAPAATLFAFTSLRGTMPGSPPFGAFIDYVGSLPCLAILSLSASLTTGIYLVRDPTNPDKAFANPTAGDIATQRFADTLLSASDAITYQAQCAEAASRHSPSDTWKAEGARMKTTAAAHKAIDAAFRTVQAAEENTGRSQANEWRKELRNLEMRVIAAGYSPGGEDADPAEEAAKGAGDAADAARDAIQVAKKATAAAADSYVRRRTAADEKVFSEDPEKE